MDTYTVILILFKACILILSVLFVPALRRAFPFSRTHTPEQAQERAEDNTGCPEIEQEGQEVSPGEQRYSDSLWSPNGKFIAFTLEGAEPSDPRRTVYVCRSLDGKIFDTGCFMDSARFGGREVCLLWSPDSSRLLIESDPITLWDASEERSIRIPSRSAFSGIPLAEIPLRASFSRDGQRIAASYLLCTEWGAESTGIRITDAHTGRIESEVFIGVPGGSFLETGVHRPVWISDDQFINIGIGTGQYYKIDLTDGLVTAFPYVEGDSRCLTASPDGNYLSFLAAQNNTTDAVILDVRTWARTVCHNACGTTAEWTPDGKMLVTKGSGKIKVFALNGKQIPELYDYYWDAPPADTPGVV